MLTGWAIHCGNITLPGVLVLIAVWYWGIRLTGNWAYTFRNLDTEDWRYTKYRTEQKPFIFQIINFFGLNMMPTIVVFLAMLPAIGFDFLRRDAVHHVSGDAVHHVSTNMVRFCRQPCRCHHPTDCRHAAPPFRQGTQGRVVEARAPSQLLRGNLDVVGHLDHVCFC